MTYQYSNSCVKNVWESDILRTVPRDRTAFESRPVDAYIKKVCRNEIRAREQCAYDEVVGGELTVQKRIAHTGEYV